MDQGKLIRGLILGLPIGLVASGVFALSFCGDASNPKKGQPRYVSKATISESALRKYVGQFAEIGERNLNKFGALQDGAQMFREYWGRENTGYDVKRQIFKVKERDCENVEVEVIGTSYPDEIIVIGAHYDTAAGSPGADDNASGAAALIALAQAFVGSEPKRTIRFVAFTTEEPPYFQTDDMGSVHYARRCKERNEKITAMISLESIGYFSDEEGSQKYPPQMAGNYPTKGNFIAVVGNVESEALVNKVGKHLTDGARPLPVVKAAKPAGIPGIGFSDQWSFWQEGYRGVMITDTALFRNPHYHKSEDTPDKLDFKRFQKVVLGMENVIWALANE